MSRREVIEKSSANRDDLFVAYFTSICRMNWIGGARSRVKFQGERKIQQEFFERKRLEAARSFAARTPVKKRGVSQDLIALHTVSRLHSRNNAGTRNPINKIDLEKFTSCTRQIDEVDIGPCSPSQTPSRLLLNDSSSDKLRSYVPKTTERQFSAKRDEMTSGLQCMMKDSEVNQSGLETSMFQDDRMQRERSQTPFLESKTSNNINSTWQHKQFPGTAATTPFSFSISKPGHGFNKMKCNLLAPEDFQVTPLVKYSKKYAPSETDIADTNKHHLDKDYRHKLHDFKRESYDHPGTHGHRRHRHSSNHENCEHKSHKRPKYDKFSCFETSTPTKHDSNTKKTYSRRIETFGDVSPIVKKDGLLEDDFQYKPRLMMTPANQNIINESTGSFSFSDIPDQNRHSSCSTVTEGSAKCFQESRETTVANRVTLFMNDDYKTSKDQTVIPYENTNESHLFEKEVLQSTTFPEMSHTSSSLRNKLPVKSKLTHLEKASSLSKFKCTPVQEGIKETKGLTGNKLESKEETYGNSSMLNLSKPNLDDSEDEGFQYKPLDTSKLKAASFPGLMNMYATLSGNRGNVETSSHSEKQKQNIRQAACKLSGGSVQRVLSPVHADEFPAHLLSPSEQLQNDIDKELACIAKGELNSDRSMASVRPGCYRPLKPGMDEVMHEINELENRENGLADKELSQNDSVDDEVKMSLQVKEGVVSTESTEADTYMETEEYLANAELQYLDDLKNGPDGAQNISWSSQEEPYVGENHQTKHTAEKDDFSNIEFTAELYTVPFCDKTSEITGVKNTGTSDILQDQYNSHHVLDTTQEEKEEDNKICRIELLNSTGNSPTGDSLKNSKDEVISTSQDEQLQGSLSACSQQASATGSDKQVILKGNESLPSKEEETFMDENVEETGSNAKMNQTHGNETEIDKRDSVSSGRDQHKNMIFQVQDPEISIGVSQGTQTETCSPKILIEASTSPLLFIRTTKETREVAIQSDEENVPCLSNLASGILKYVKHISNPGHSKDC